ncbi:MAG TPA: flagellar protein FlaG [Alphaproteobacteria bacterium]|jgi:flagellar protein FlaG
MDVQTLSAPTASAPATHRFDIQTGKGGAAQAARIEIPDIEIAPARPLPAAMELQLDVDQATRTVIGRIVDKQTGEVVKQIPSEEMVHLMARNAELLGALLNKKA